MRPRIQRISAAFRSALARAATRRRLCGAAAARHPKELQVGVANFRHAGRHCAEYTRRAEVQETEPARGLVRLRRTRRG